MKLLNNKSFVRKILIVLVAMILVNFTIPIQSQADDDFGGKLFTPIAQLLAAIADVPIGLLQHSMLGVTNIVDSVTLDYYEDNINMTGGGVWSPDNPNYKDSNSENGEIKIEKIFEYGKDLSSEGFAGFGSNDIEIPNILYCPEYIFANRIAALDVNFINPGTYTGGENNNEINSIAKGTLSKTVSSWYKALRNVAIVGLLSILVYIGIRILLGSTAQDKAKYKERLRDWFVGLCLVFAMHYIMAGVMLVSEVITTNIGNELDNNMIKVTINDYEQDEHDGPISFVTNYMGYIRLLVQSKNLGDAFAYLIMYIALVIFTIMFTITYLKRVLYMAFFTMIAPLVAMTYPLDKLADGHAQGFNMWFREYMLNAIIQPVHLVLYMIIMGSVIELAVDNPIYGIVAIGFLIPAEKFIKKMFRFDKGETTSALGAVAGGALAMKGVQAVGGMARKIAGGKEGQDKVRTKENAAIEANTNSRKRDRNVPDPESVLLGESLSNPSIAAQGSEGINTQTSRRSRLRPATGFDDETPTNANRFRPATGFDDETPEQATSEGYRLGRGNLILTASNSSNNVNPVNNSDNSQPSNAQPNNSQQTRVRQVPNIPTANATPTGPAIRAQAVGGSRNPDSLRSRAGRVKGVIAGGVSRGVQRGASSVKRKAINGVKSLPKTALKLGGAAVGAAALGAVAAGAALTTGDLKTAASMVGAGTWVGGSVGKAIGGRSAGALEEAATSTSQAAATIKDAWYTEDDKAKAKQAKKDKYDAEWRLKEENYKYLRKKHMNDNEAKEYLKDSRTQAFLNAGITDINTIYNARKLMDESDGRINIEGAVARAELSKRVSDNFSNNDQEQISFMDNMKKRNTSFNDDNVRKLVEDIKKIKDTDS